MSDKEPVQGSVAEDERIQALDERLDALRKREDARNRPKASVEADENYRIGNRVLSELLGGLAGGLFLGWLIDHFAGTSPWGLLGMMFFGIFIAFRNILRITNQRPD